MNHRRVCLQFVVDIGLAVGTAPQIECPPSPHGWQSLAELAKYVVVAEEGCYADDSPVDETAL